MVLARENLVAKTINEQKVKARDLLNYFTSYIEIFNSEKLPEPTTILQVFFFINLHSSIRNIFCIAGHFSNIRDTIKRVKKQFWDHTKCYPMCRSNPQHQSSYCLSYYTIYSVNIIFISVVLMSIKTKDDKVSGFQYMENCPRSGHLAFLKMKLFILELGCKQTFAR